MTENKSKDVVAKEHHFESKCSNKCSDFDEDDYVDTESIFRRLAQLENDSKVRDEKIAIIDTIFARKISIQKLINKVTELRALAYEASGLIHDERKSVMDTCDFLRQFFEDLQKNDDKKK